MRVGKAALQGDQEDAIAPGDADHEDARDDRDRDDDQTVRIVLVVLVLEAENFTSL